jgi:hypothetical protein
VLISKLSNKAQIIRLLFIYQNKFIIFDLYSIFFLPDFDIYNNYKNHIINNKSDKSKILNLRMAVRHCQWCGANAPLPMASLCKRATASGVFTEMRN